MLKRNYRTKLNIKDTKTLESLKKLAGVYRKFYNAGLNYLDEVWHGAEDLNHENIEEFRKYGTLNCRQRTQDDVVQLLRKKQRIYPYTRKLTLGLIDAAAKASHESYSNFRYKAWQTDIDNSRKGIWSNTYTLDSPKYMSRKKSGTRFRVDRIKVFYDYVNIPKFGSLKLSEKGYLPQGMHYSDISFSFDGKDWWINLKVSEKLEKEPNLEGSINIDFDTNGSLLVNNEKFADSVATSKGYQKANLRYKKALRKFNRQVSCNTSSPLEGRVVCRTSRNMVKTRKKLQILSNRLKHIKKDHFRKVAKELAKTKPLNVFALSDIAIKKYKNGFLSQQLRESGALEFFNIVMKNLALLGSNIIRCNSPSQMLSAS